MLPRHTEIQLSSTVSTHPASPAKNKNSSTLIATRPIFSNMPASAPTLSPHENHKELIWIS